MNSACIEVCNVSKLFWLTRDRASTVSGFIIDLLGRRRRHGRRGFLALRNVTFSVPAGETLGIIGPNGSGKSTLLKLITGIFPPTTGTITVQGRLVSLLELGAGFHGDLSGRENIYLNGSLLGRTRAQMNALLKPIAEFAEIGSFLDTPLKHYSSGMKVRLGFAVAMHLEADIMLLDEVFAVGDMHFQARCIQRLREFQAEGRTLLLVSHSMELIRALCSRAAWLSRGKLMDIGPVDQVVDAYTQYMSYLA